MKISRAQACQILCVSEGANLEEIRSSYKHLARKWHPDKQDGSVGSEEATQKFQEVSAAYKRLTSNERDSDEDGMTLAEMMELYRQFFSFGNAMGQCNCPHHHPPYYRYNEDISDYDDYDYTEDEDSDDEFWESITSRLRNKFEARKYMQKDTTDIPRSKITEEEALKNAQELIEEEEIEKRRKEKKKAKKKKKKEKRKQKEKGQKTENDKDENYFQEEKVIPNEKEQKSDAKLPTERISNGHLPSAKSNQPNLPIKNNSKKLDKGMTEKLEKPIKRVIVQEDIRPSITKESKQDKGNKFKKDIRSLLNGKDSSDGEEQFDASSAFFARAASKAPSNQLPQQNSTQKDVSESKNFKKDPIKKNNSPRIKETNKVPISTKEKKEENQPIFTETVKNSIKAQNSINTKLEASPVIDDVIIKSRELAVEGNNLASKEKYHEAITKFSEAIKLDPTDFRFFGNRSYCFDRTRQFEKALQDAESAIHLAAQWAKGYFRKGRALTGLQRYQEAEAAFQIVLKLDADCPDAQFELAKVRVRILTDMGFDVELAEESVKKHGTVQSALEALLAGNITPRSDGDENVYLSETDYDVTNKPCNQQSEKQTIRIATPTKTKQQQTCTALWVGNVCPESVSDKQLTQLFAKCGKLVSVRLLPEKYCAFINYQLPEDASEALEKLQGFEIGGQNLLIRYPNNPPPGSSVHQGIPEKGSSTSQNNKKSAEKGSLSKVTGPVNGNECYFWRTTGCVFDNHCRYRHVADHKGIDLPKVHAKYGNLL